MMDRVEIRKRNTDFETGWEQKWHSLQYKELTPNQLLEAYPLISQLRKHLSVEEFVETAKQMMTCGYRAICLYDGKKILAYAGFAELLNLYYGRHIWIYELVVDEENRGKGLGKILLSHIEDYAKEKNLSCIALSSSLEKENAHRFYEGKMDFGKVSYVFKKDLGKRGLDKGAIK